MRICVGGALAACVCAVLHVALRNPRSEPVPHPVMDGHYDPDNIFAGTPSLSLLRILLAKKVLKR